MARQYNIVKARKVLAPFVIAINLACAFLYYKVWQALWPVADGWIAGGFVLLLVVAGGDVILNILKTVKWYRQ